MCYACITPPLVDAIDDICSIFSAIWLRGGSVSLCSTFAISSNAPFVDNGILGVNGVVFVSTKWTKSSDVLCEWSFKLASSIGILFEIIVAVLVICYQCVLWMYTVMHR